MRRLRLFGHCLGTAERFPTPLTECEAPPDLSFRRVREAPFAVGAEPGALDVPLGQFGEERFQLFCRPGLDVLRRTGAIEFFVEPETISARLLDPQREFLLDIGFFGLAMPLWLERRGWPVLHASAVSLGGNAVGFLASASGGKSSLALALMEAGGELLTDDALALEERPGGLWYAHPSYPQVRLWPADARRLRGSVEGLERSHPSVEKLRVPVGLEPSGMDDVEIGGWGRFAQAAAPLRVIYLPQRSTADGAVRIEPIQGTRAAIALMRQMALPALSAAAGLQQQRFDRLTRLASRLSIRRLELPADAARLPEVAARLQDDLATSGWI